MLRQYAIRKREKTSLGNGRRDIDVGVKEMKRNQTENATRQVTRKKQETVVRGASQSLKAPLRCSLLLLPLLLSSPFQAKGEDGKGRGGIRSMSDR